MRVLTLDMMNDDCVIPKINENIKDGITLKIIKIKKKNEKEKVFQEINHLLKANNKEIRFKKSAKC